MNSFKSYLEEGRDAPLYHGTSISAIRHMLKGNILRGVTKHSQIKNSKRDTAKDVVSLTRSYKFAVTWGQQKNGDFLVLEINQRKLAQTHKLLPYNHFGDQKIDGAMSARKLNDIRVKDWGEFPINQYEENVIGDIKNLNNYITKIIIDDKTNTRELSAFSREPKDGLIKNHPKLYSMQEKRFVNAKV